MSGAATEGAPRPKQRPKGAGKATAKATQPPKAVPAAAKPPTSKAPALAAAATLAAAAPAPRTSPLSKRWATLAADPGQLEPSADRDQDAGSRASSRAPSQKSQRSQRSQASGSTAPDSAVGVQVRAVIQTAQDPRAQELMNKFRRAAEAMGMQLEDVMADHALSQDVQHAVTGGSSRAQGVPQTPRFANAVQKSTPPQKPCKSPRMLPPIAIHRDDMVIVPEPGDSIA